MQHNTIIIAEAGVNHNGDINLAKKLIEEAAKAGADMVKFQTFITEEVISKDAPKAQYQKNTTGNEESQFDMVKKLELSEAAHYELQAHCVAHNIQFLSTPFDLPSIDLLQRMKLEMVKIPSGEINNVPYLRHIAGKFKYYFLSTGMSDIKEIEFAVRLLSKNGVATHQITILHCNTEYPTQMEDVNLKAMKTIARHFKTNVGYSDHTIGWEVAVASVALGASVIEKHFTLDKNMAGPDHKASLEPNELKTLVDKIRSIEIALGSSEKLISDAALQNALVAKKSIVAKTDIKKDELFTEQNITVMRPGTGLSAMRWDSVIGKHAVKNFEKGDMIII
ncbi:MAG: legionaminic acid synthase [Bacteroidota bacterium]|jgi:N,N'-diacetyllegionaminate synthase